MDVSAVFSGKRVIDDFDIKFLTEMILPQFERK